jgi:hypothetical protein
VRNCTKPHTSPTTFLYIASRPARDFAAFYPVFDRGYSHTRAIVPHRVGGFFFAENCNNMIYSVTINNKAIVDNDLQLTLQQTYLLSGLHSIVANWQSMSRLNYEGRDYYWLSYSMIIEQLPLLRTKRKDGQHEPIKKDTLYGLFKELAQDGFLIAHPENQKQGRTYYGFAPKLYLLFGKNSTAEAYVNKSAPTEINPDPYGDKSRPPTDINPDNNSTNDNSTNTNKEQVFAREQTLPADQPQQSAKETAPTVAPPQPAQGDSAYTMGQAFAEAMRVEMQGRADALASYAGSFYKRDADTFLRKCITNIAPAAQTCYANDKARTNLTAKVAQAYGRMLFNRFEALCENGNGTTRFVHTQTAFEGVLMKLSLYCDAFICDVLAEATMGGWETPKTDAAQLAQKYNNWLYTHKQTENLTKVREKVESADKGQKNAFNAAIDVLTEKEMDTVNKAGKACKITKRSAGADIKAAARRAYAAIMYNRTKDPIYTHTNDANGMPMGLEAERTGDAVYAAAYAIIKANHVNW